MLLLLFAVLFFIKIYNIYCHKPDVGYNIWSSACSPHRQQPRSTSRRAQEMRMRSTKQKRENRQSFGSRSQSSAESSLCHCLHTKPLSNSRSSFRSRFHSTQSGISPALISLRFRFRFRFGFLVGASSDCDCAPVRRRRRLFNPAPQSPVRQSYPRKWPKE